MPDPEPAGDASAAAAGDAAAGAGMASGAARASGAAGASGAGRTRLTSARSKARRAALDLLFEAEQRGVEPGELLTQRVQTPVGDAPLRPYTVRIVEGVQAEREAIDDALNGYSHGWPLERMPAVDRALLRVATWEIVFNDEVPDGVAVSEAVELAALLSTDDSPNFVNGLLSRIAEVKATLR